MEVYVELRHLRYFLAVLEEQTFTAAAAKLDISQPTLSHQIRQLETLVGSALFNRIGRTISLTAAGEALVINARVAVQAADAAVHDVMSVSSLEGGILRVAAMPSARRIIASTAIEFMDRYPKVRLVLREEMGAPICGMILDGSIEVGVSIGSIMPQGVRTEVLYKEALVLAFRTEHPLGDFDELSLKDIGDRPFAVFPYDSFTMNAIQSYFERMKFTPNISLEVPSVSYLVRLIAASNIVGLVPQRSANLHKEISYRRLQRKQPTRTVSIVTNERFTRTPAAREFIKILRLQSKAAPSR
jgi:LysR family cyn operon transcriptional activator